MPRWKVRDVVEQQAVVVLRWDEASGRSACTGNRRTNASGHIRDRTGRLVSCEHLTRRGDPHRDRRFDHRADDRFDGKRLNAPNDVVACSHGSVWFSDPGYGILSDYEGRRADFESPTAVYRLDPDTGVATAVATDLQRPNGLCFSPDETRLSVVDSGSKPGIIAAYDVTDNSSALERFSWTASNCRRAAPTCLSLGRRRTAS